MSENTALQTLSAKFANKFNAGNGNEVIETLKNTAFKGNQVTDAQMSALPIVADQYGLNPFKWLMCALARYDFDRGIVPRTNNKYYIEQYGILYAIAQCQDHYTGG